MGSAPATDRLVLRRLRTEYLVAADHPAPHALRARLDDAAGRLEGTLAAAAAAFEPDDPSVWFIRRLDVAVDVDAARVRDEIAARWAQALTRTLASRMGAADGDPGIAWFASWDDYLTAFVRDLATGTAWRRWYHEGRAGLRSLPRSVAVRTALAERPDRGMRALARLTPADLGCVLDALEPADAARLLTALTRDARGDERACHAALRDAGRMRDGRGDALVALAWCVAVARRRPELVGAPLRRVALALAAAVRLLSAGDRSRGARLLAAIERGDRGAIAALAGAADAVRLAPLAGVRDPALAALVHRGGPAPAPAAPRSTRFGGAFLLAPGLDALPIPAATAGWPDPAGSAATPVLRLLALATALGPASLEDAVVRELAGVPAGLEPEALEAWPGRVPRAAVTAAAAIVARHLVATGQAAGDHVAVTSARLAHRPATVLIDAPRGHWLAVGAAPPTAAALARAAPAPARVVAGRRCAAPTAAAWPDAAVQDLGPAPAGAAGDASGPDGERVLRAEAERLPRELAALAAPLPCPPGLERLLALIAHALVRGLARRLPGFGHAGVAHLRANVLDAPASIEAVDGRRVVHLGPAPLGVVLSLTGLTRTVYDAPWSDGPPFAIYPADGP